MAHLQLEACTVDVDQGIVVRDGTTLHLGPRERRVLAYLVERSGRPVDRDALVDDIWGGKAGRRAADVVVTRLRTKLERDPRAPRHLLTVTGTGYVLVIDPVGTAVPAAPLPPEPGPLLGRDGLAADILAALDRGPLTLVGPGGAGKTRLALRVAHRVADEQAVVWCALLTVAPGGSPIPAIGAALGVDRTPGWRGRLDAILAGRPPTLYVLDNAEHLPDAAALVHRIRAANPDAKVLTTSRSPLADEATLEVGPLPTPAGIALLRTRSASPVDASDAVLGELVARLDGLPLALELAAARLTVLARLDERLALLRVRRRGGDPRHAALQACLDWSWGLLDATERRALAQATVFAGRFTDADASQVLDDPGALSRLAGHSLLHRQPDGWALLEAVRAYATAHLTDRRPVEDRHTRWIAAHVAALREAADRLRPHARDRLAAAVPDARRAIDRADPATAARLWVDLTPLLASAFSADEVDAALTALLPALSDRELHRRALVQRAAARIVLARFDAARDDLDAALAEPSSPFDRARALDHRATTHRKLGDIDAAVADLSDAIALFDEAECPAWIGRARCHLAETVRRRGEFSRAVALLRDAAAVARSTHDDHGLAVALANLAGLLWMTEHPQGAREAAEQALAPAQRVGDQRLLAYVEAMLGNIALERGDRDEARRLLHGALRRHRALGAREHVAGTHSYLGDLAVLDDDRIAAARHYAEALALHTDLDDPPWMGTDHGKLALVDIADGRLRDALHRTRQAAALLHRAGDAQNARYAALTEAAILGLLGQPAPDLPPAPDTPYDRACHDLVAACLDPTSDAAERTLREMSLETGDLPAPIDRWPFVRIVTLALRRAVTRR